MIRMMLLLGAVVSPDGFIVTKASDLPADLVLCQWR